MEKYKLLASIVFLLFLSCKNEDERANTNRRNNSVIKKDKDDKIQEKLILNKNLNDFIGEYRFLNEEDPSHNLFLKLEKKDIKELKEFEGYAWEEKDDYGKSREVTLQGFLYANTELYEDTGEGYEKGYFVAKVKVEPLEEKLLKIIINVKPSEILERPIVPPIKSSFEAIKKGNKVWSVNEYSIAKELVFEIVNDHIIILKTDFSDKEFKKK